MWMNIVIGLAILIALFVIIVAMRPSGFRVSRSISIAAPPESVFGHVNELRQWEHWSPWEKIDPSMKRIFEGPPSGVGAVYRWDGNNQVGAGSNTIVESQPNELVRFRLEMLRPYVGSNDVDFTFQPESDGTKVTWTMVGNLNFITKIMDLVLGMDKMVGSQFQDGLNQLKAVAENKSK